MVPSTAGNEQAPLRRYLDEWIQDDNVRKRGPGSTMWQLYTSIAIGGVLLMTAPPKDVEDKSMAPAVAFILTWPIYLLLDLAQEYVHGRRR